MDLPGYVRTTQQSTTSKPPPHKSNELLGRRHRVSFLVLWPSVRPTPLSDPIPLIMVRRAFACQCSLVPPGGGLHHPEIFQHTRDGAKSNRLWLGAWVENHPSAMSTGIRCQGAGPPDPMNHVILNNYGSAGSLVAIGMCSQMPQT